MRQVFPFIGPDARVAPRVVGARAGGGGRGDGGADGPGRVRAVPGVRGDVVQGAEDGCARDAGRGVVHQAVPAFAVRARPPDVVPQRGLDASAVVHPAPDHGSVPQPVPQPHPPDHGPDRLHAHPGLHGVAVPRQGAVLGPLRGTLLRQNAARARETRARDTIDGRFARGARKRLGILS